MTLFTRSCEGVSGAVALLDTSAVGGSWGKGGMPALRGAPGRIMHALLQNALTRFSPVAPSHSHPRSTDARSGQHREFDRRHHVL